MVGADYKEYGFDLQVQEQACLEQPPPYLLAEQNSFIEAKKSIADIDKERLKTSLRKWAKAIALMNENVIHSKKENVFN